MISNPQTEPFGEPGDASAEAGHVVLDGPNGIAITLTADAAVIMGERLICAGEEARRQQGDPSNT